MQLLTQRAIGRPTKNVEKGLVQSHSRAHHQSHGPRGPKAPKLKKATPTPTNKATSPRTLECSHDDARPRSRLPGTKEPLFGLVQQHR